MMQARSAPRWAIISEPVDKNLAGQIEDFIADWQAQQRQKATQ